MGCGWAEDGCLDMIEKVTVRGSGIHYVNKGPHRDRKTCIYVWRKVA